jgi:hypothetical protein
MQLKSLSTARRAVSFVYSTSPQARRRLLAGCSLTAIGVATGLAVADPRAAHADTIVSSSVAGQTWGSGNFTITNTGTITGANTGIGVSSSVGTLTNSGLVTVTNITTGVGVVNSGILSAINNVGTIQAPIAINSSGGSIGTITNSGVIAGNISTTGQDLTLYGGCNSSCAVYGAYTGYGGGVGTITASGLPFTRTTA